MCIIDPHSCLFVYTVVDKSSLFALQDDEIAIGALCTKILDEWMRRETDREVAEAQEEEEKTKKLTGMYEMMMMIIIIIRRRRRRMKKTKKKVKVKVKMKMKKKKTKENEKEKEKKKQQHMHVCTYNSKRLCIYDNFKHTYSHTCTIVS